RRAAFRRRDARAPPSRAVRGTRRCFRCRCRVPTAPRAAPRTRARARTRSAGSARLPCRAPRTEPRRGRPRRWPAQAARARPAPGTSRRAPPRAPRALARSLRGSRPSPGRRRGFLIAARRWIRRRFRAPRRDLSGSRRPVRGLLVLAFRRRRRLVSVRERAGRATGLHELGEGRHLLEIAGAEGVREITELLAQRIRAPAAAHRKLFLRHGERLA